MSKRRRSESPGSEAEEGEVLDAYDLTGADNDAEPNHRRRRSRDRDSHEDSDDDDRREERWPLPPFDDVHAQKHLRQVLANPGTGYVSRTDLEFSRTLPDDMPRRAYRRRQTEVKTVIHWGQRKLLLSEVEFLTKYTTGEDDVVVYAGAAPGLHIVYLMELFPDLSFVLIDPAPFCNGLRESDRVLLRREMFTDDIAAEYKGKDVLFICDVRSADVQYHAQASVDERVKEDMEAQQQWHVLMQPRKSMLKFRLPWGKGITEYLDGDVYFPIWGPVTTTECRLVPSSGTKGYDNTGYEQQMFYFNTEYRVGRYRHHVAGEGMDFCFDCRSEAHILTEYVRTQRPRVHNVEREAAEISYEISRALARNRSLFDPNSDPDTRNAGIRSRQYVHGKPAYERGGSSAHSTPLLGPRSGAASLLGSPKTPSALFPPGFRGGSGRGSGPPSKRNRLDAMESRLGTPLHPSATAGSTVFVGGLSASVTKEQLWEAFGKCGTVRDVRMIPDRAYAFVELDSPAEALKAVDTASGTPIGDSIVRVSLATDKQQGRMQNIRFGGMPFSPYDGPRPGTGARPEAEIGRQLVVYEEFML
eukprot:m.170617 g.170617  ORF g.170617 m.170617 type:complete len:586 (+) comp17831_c2_seq1:1052-2809(+)